MHFGYDSVYSQAVRMFLYVCELTQSIRADQVWADLLLYKLQYYGCVGGISSSLETLVWSFCKVYFHIHEYLFSYDIMI